MAEGGSNVNVHYATLPEYLNGNAATPPNRNAIAIQPIMPQQGISPASNQDASSKKRVDLDAFTTNVTQVPTTAYPRYGSQQWINPHYAQQQPPIATGLAALTQGAAVRTYLVRDEPCPMAQRTPYLPYTAMAHLHGDLRWCVWQTFIRESERTFNGDGRAGFVPFSHATKSTNIERTPKREFPKIGQKTKAARSSFFVNDELENLIRRKQLAEKSKIPSTTELNVPNNLRGYRDFFPLEPMVNAGDGKGVVSNNGGRRADRHVTTTFRVTREKDANNYCLRRVHDFILENAKWAAHVERWKQIEHPNVVSLRNVFTTKNEFQEGENSLVFIHDFHPDAETLLDFFNRREMEGWREGRREIEVAIEASSQHPGIDLRRPKLFPESTVWSFIMQLSSAIREVHSKGLALRSLHDPTKILVLNGGERLKISCTGSADVYLPYDPSNLPQFQSADLHAFAALVLCMADQTFRPEASRMIMPMVLDLQDADLKRFVRFLGNSDVNMRDINDIIPAIGQKFWSILQELDHKADWMEVEMMKGMENGRLFRTIAALNSILDRHHMCLDYQWSEEGDRFILKLFRDYVFHQVADECGTPDLQMANVISCLNKLDHGSPERICLVSPDGNNVIIVSYADVKEALSNAMEEIQRPSLPTLIRGEVERNRERGSEAISVKSVAGYGAVAEMAAKTHREIAEKIRGSRTGFVIPPR